MNKIIKTCVLHMFLAITCLLTTQAIASSEKLIWSGMGGNAAHTAYVDAVSDVTKFKELWTKEFQDSTSDYIGKSDMTVTNYALYITSNLITPFEHDAIYSVNPETGDIIWKQLLPKWMKTYYISAPVYNDGKLFINAGKNDILGFIKLAYIVQFNAVTGKMGNSSRIKLSYIDALQSPIIFDNLLYSYGNSESEITEFNTEKGHVKKVIEIASNDKAPTITKDFIIRSSGHKFQVINRETGQLNFMIPVGNIIPGKIITNNWNYPHIYDANTNMIYGMYLNTDTFIYTLYAFDLTSHSIKWSYQFEKTKSSVQRPMAFADGVIYLISDWKLVAIDANTGKLLWQTKLDGDEKYESIWSLVASKNHIFISGETIHTSAINRETHQKEWETETKGKLILGDKAIYILGLRYGDHTQTTPITAVAIN